MQLSAGSDENMCVRVFVERSDQLKYKAYHIQPGPFVSARSTYSHEVCIPILERNINECASRLCVHAHTYLRSRSSFLSVRQQQNGEENAPFYTNSLIRLYKQHFKYVCICKLNYYNQKASCYQTQSYLWYIILPATVGCRASWRARCLSTVEMILRQAALPQK